MENLQKEIQLLVDNIKILSDEKARTLVGILCKRIEILDEEEQEQQRKTNNPQLKVLTASLYKKLVKELIYEQNRVFKELLDIYTIPELKIRNKGSEQK